MAQDYQARLRIPVDGDPAMRLFTRSGTLVADGYLRVVIGGRGPYIEFQTVWQSHMRVPAEELYRFNDPHVYYGEYRSHDKSDVKIYWQKKTVDYADYRVGRYYISRHDSRHNPPSSSASRRRWIMRTIVSGGITSPLSTWSMGRRRI